MFGAEVQAVEKYLIVYYPIYLLSCPPLLRMATVFYFFTRSWQAGPFSLVHMWKCEAVLQLVT